MSLRGLRFSYSVTSVLLIQPLDRYEESTEKPSSMLMKCILLFEDSNEQLEE